MAKNFGVLAVIIVGLSGFIVYDKGLLNQLIDSQLTQVCEEQIKNRLRSPLTYVRIEINKYEEGIRTDDIPNYYDHDISAAQLRSIANGGLQPTNFQIFVKYDAANAYGTPINSTSMCEYFSMSGNTDSASALNVKVDGQTNHERLINGLLDN